MRRLLFIPLALLLVALGPTMAGSAVVPTEAPRGFVGMSPQGPTNGEDYELMSLAGVKSVRLPLNWKDIVPNANERFDVNWEWFDGSVRLAAEHRIRAFPFLWGTPEWLSPRLGGEPVETARQRREWLRFLRDAVKRYGPDGTFWDENPELPRLPVRQWEVWNEENIVTFSREPDPDTFARLIRISGGLIHRLDPGATVILGGLFGRPLQVPPNIHSATFLAGVYETPGIKRHFDGVALHPYVADAAAMESQIENLRSVMRFNHDAGAKLYVTEMGWGSDGFESRWERGPRGQARELDRSFAMLVGNRGRWRIGGVWWFSWADIGGNCQFCDSAGLLTIRREAKPAWYRFNAWTGGDARTVPRASARALREAP
jgi:hypothetical protein